MHDAADVVCPFLAHDGDGVGSGVARVDDQGFPAGSGGANVGAKAAALPLGVPVAAVVVQAGFADGHDFRVRGERAQAVLGRLLSAFMVGMYADGGEYVSEALSQRSGPAANPPD